MILCELHTLRDALILSRQFSQEDIDKIYDVYEDYFKRTNDWECVEMSTVVEFREHKKMTEKQINRHLTTEAKHSLIDRLPYYWTISGGTKYGLLHKKVSLFVLRPKYDSDVYRPNELDLTKEYNK